MSSLFTHDNFNLHDEFKNLKGGFTKIVLVVEL